MIHFNAAVERGPSVFGPAHSVLLAANFTYLVGLEGVPSRRHVSVVVT